MGIVGFTPLVAFVAIFIYEYTMVGKLLSVGDHRGVIDELCNCYGNLLLIYGAAIMLTILVLIYFIVHVAKIKAMNGATKTLWICFLAAFVPLSFPVFWYFQIKREPARLETKPDWT